MTDPHGIADGMNINTVPGWYRAVLQWVRDQLASGCQ